MISIRKITREIIPQKNVGRVTIVNLCTSSGHALHVYQSFMKLSRTVSKL